MRSISDILNLAKDGVITTKEQAAAIIEEEVTARMSIALSEEEEARSIIKANIGYCTGYMTPEQADKINDLFNTEHPVWGRSHPTPKQALRLGIEYADRGKDMERPIDDQKQDAK